MRLIVTQIRVTLLALLLLAAWPAAAQDEPPVVAGQPADATDTPDQPAEEPVQPPDGPPDEPPTQPQPPEQPVDDEPVETASEDEAPKQAAKVTTPPPRSEEAAADGEAATDAKPGEHVGSFGFGSYGRVIAATDAQGRPGRDVDVVAHGSRLDHDNYVELELRRDDHWLAVAADTRFVATLAFGNPIFHYNGEFDAAVALRNLYIEETGLGLEGLSMWAGSRMLRGDDIYLLDFWPLDNLNTLGAGVRYEAKSLTTVGLHFGVAQPDNPFYKQQAERPRPLNQFGTATVDILDRLRMTGSLKAEQQFRFGDDGAGMKLALYGEVHQLPSGQRETSLPGQFEDVPKDQGYVIGAQVGGFTGDRDTHVNMFVRYATGLAAYGEFARPAGLGLDRTTGGAHEILFAVGGNWEFGPMAVMLGGYFRSFRNANDSLDFEDVDEGIIIARPQVFITDWAGIGVEGSYQAQQRGVVADVGDAADGTIPTTEPKPVVGRIARIGVIPFITPAGRGSFSRPVFWFIYSAASRDEGARALYPVDDVYSVRELEHFVGVGAEWWFGSSSYGEKP
jgi:hypothetical protein